MQLVERILQATEMEVRKAGFEALRSHIHGEETIASTMLLKGLFNPVVKRTMEDLVQMEAFFTSRWHANGADAHIAYAGAARVDIIKHLLTQNSTSDLRGPIFEPFRWSREFGGKSWLALTYKRSWRAHILLKERMPSFWQASLSVQTWTKRVRPFRHEQLSVVTCLARRSILPQRVCRLNGMITASWPYHHGWRYTFLTSEHSNRCPTMFLVLNGLGR